MSKCPVCAASFPITQFVCEYCGHVETERVKTIDANTVKEISFKDSMDVIKDNLNALQEIRLPTAGGNLLAILRIIVAIQTFGIALIFWKKPKTRFNQKEFNKLKAIVSRNIELLKLSAKGSEQLQDRINVTQKELTNIDHKIRNSILIRRVVTIVFVVAYLVLIFMPKGGTSSNMDVIPASTIVEGNLSENLEVVIEKYPIVYTKDKENNIERINITVNLRVTKEYKFADNEWLNVSMILKSKFGNEIPFFSKSKLNERNTERLVRAINRGSKKDFLFTFYFKPESEIKKVPKILAKFSVHATVDTTELK